MSAPDKCPKCGEGKCRDTVGKREYLCGTWQFHHKDGVAESITCLANQLKMRDARIKDLEAERNKAVARYECVRRMNATEFAHLLQDCVFKDLRFDDEVDRRIKKTKP